MKTVLHVFLYFSLISFTSGCGSISNTSKLVEKGKIPAGFGSSDEILLCLIPDDEGTASNIENAFGFYKGKVKFITYQELRLEKEYSNYILHRFIITHEISGPAIVISNIILTDRKDGSMYRKGSSSFPLKIYSNLAKQLEDKRLTYPDY